MAERRDGRTAKKTLDEETGREEAGDLLVRSEESCGQERQAHAVAERTVRVRFHRRYAN